MKRTIESRPADFVHARMSGERLSALWAGIQRIESARSVRRVRLRRAAAAGALLGVAALTVALLVRSPSRTTPAATPERRDHPIEEVASSSNQISLADGSTLALSDDARTQVVRMTQSEVRVRLDQGEVECDVAPVAGRLFVVEAGGFEVLVRGTRFSVGVGRDASSPAAAWVSVTRGAVEVRKLGDEVIARLGPGERLRLQHAGWTAAPQAPGALAPKP